MNLNLIQSLSALSGLIVSGSGLLIIIVGAFYLVKSGVGKTVNDANKDAITALQATIAAMQADVSILRGKMEDVTKENIRLKQTIDTICAALKIRGMVITIQGEMVSIEDKNGKSTTARIHDQKEAL